MKAEYLAHMGTDLDVVNNARVSFDKASDWALRCVQCGTEVPPFVDAVCCCTSMYKPVLCEKDRRLIQFLARGCTSGDWQDLILDVESSWGELVRIENLLNYVRNMPTHWTPFANGIQVKFRITAPIPIMRQVFKHKVGAVENEVSRRYVDDEPVIFTPTFRRKAENVKQGSSDEEVDDVRVYRAYNDAVQACLDAYSTLLLNGVAPEQARFVLPQAMMSTAIVTNSLYGWSRFHVQRGDRNHAQREVADLSDQIAAKCSELFPVSWEALTA